MTVLKFLADHAADLLAVAGALCVAGAAFARMTPTDKDDALFAKIGSWLTKAGTLGLAKSKAKLDA